ncbi:hypothetical protein HRbin06_00592 [archaeon HR06]|nr:hypothetical protein HRbin06_00592 [archaeon HR06]
MLIYSSIAFITLAVSLKVITEKSKNFIFRAKTAREADAKANLSPAMDRLASNIKLQANLFGSFN